MHKPGPANIKILSLLAGIGVFVVFFFTNPFNVESKANLVLSIAALMVTWWVTEALPMPVVALLPLILFPLLGIETIEKTAAPYANPVIFLFMGGFMLGLAIEKWNLHKRIALNIVRLTGTSGNRIILGFILSTGLISMWLSNTATTMMMFPIALSVIHVMKENHQGEGNFSNFAFVLMLVIAYSSNIGGIATIIGTPPNVAYAAHIRSTYNANVDFIDWMLICTPLSIVLLFALYVTMKTMFPNRIKSDESTKAHIRDEIASLGPLSKPEARVLAIFLATAFLWITKDIINSNQPWFRLDDSIIALIGATVLFVFPAGNKKDISILEWGDTKTMAWGILLLFGGGIALAGALEKVGLIQQLGQWLGQFGGSRLLLIFVITLVSLFISELMSNVAQVIVFAPVVSSLAEAIGINPLLLGIPMTLAASCAGMLPMGTPPNAIVFSSGHIKLRQMTKAGFVMNIVAVVMITVFCYFFLPMVFK